MANADPLNGVDTALPLLLPLPLPDPLEPDVPLVTVIASTL
jgi:hypothetical protein